MSKKRFSAQLLVQLVILDTIGTALFGLGLYDGFIASAPIVPENFAFAGYAYLLLGLGILLQLPMIIAFVVRRGANLRE